MEEQDIEANLYPEQVGEIFGDLFGPIEDAPTYWRPPSNFDVQKHLEEVRKRTFERGDNPDDLYRKAQAGRYALSENATAEQRFENNERAKLDMLWRLLQDRRTHTRRSPKCVVLQARPARGGNGHTFP